MISQISIRNFRSISSLDLSANWLTTLVGANDAGKSNVLRALNLFFNEETDPDEDYEFTRDFNKFAAERRQKAPQTEIRVRFLLPESYRRPGLPHEVEWRKVWRREGQVSRMETRTYLGGEDFPPRSKIPALLDRIRYTYIPAIKDRAFFADLQGRLYDVLASVAEGPLKESAGAFQEQLGAQLRALLSALRDAFASEASMRLPENLRDIFESLEISSDGIPLSRRGDGIKIRHIPMILRFIADKQDELLTSGGVRYTHLWGFEEPENNVEMSAAFQMASELVQLVANADHFQLFITTHSPIFYRLDEQHPEAADWVSTHFVSKVDGETRAESRAPDQVDESMGLMPLVAPYLKKAKAEFDSVTAELRRTQEMAAQPRPTVFVEGSTDRQVLEKAWEVFGYPAGAIRFDDGGEDYGSANALVSRGLAWALLAKHQRPDGQVRAVILFDDDAAGRKARTELSDRLVQLNARAGVPSALLLPPPERLVPLRRQGFRPRIDLEAYYSDRTWARAAQDADLEDHNDLTEVLSDTMLRGLAAGGENPFSGLDEADALRVRKGFGRRAKVKVATRIARMTPDAAVLELDALRPLLVTLAQTLRIGFGGDVPEG